MIMQSRTKWTICTIVFGGLWLAGGGWLFLPAAVVCLTQVYWYRYDRLRNQVTKEVSKGA